MPINREIYINEQGSEKYSIRRIIHDNYVTLELRHTDWYQADLLEFERRSPEDFDRPPVVILAKVIISPENGFTIFCMGDKFPGGIPLYRREFQILREFFDRVEAERCHTENIEDSPVELEARNLLGTDKE